MPVEFNKGVIYCVRLIIITNDTDMMITFITRIM